MSFTCISIDGKQRMLPIIDKEEVRDFNLRVEKEYGQYNDGDTSLIAILYLDVLINTTENRHKLIRDFITDDNEKTKFYISLLPSPALFVRLRGNVRKDHFIPDIKTCSICLEDFAEEGTAGTTPDDLWIALSCLHRFHQKCLAEIKNDSCPLCRKPLKYIETWILTKFF